MSKTIEKHVLMEQLVNIEKPLDQNVAVDYLIANKIIIPEAVL